MKAFFLILLSCLPAISQSYVLRIATNAPVAGDLIIWSGSAWVPLARGTNGQVLTATASSITWSNAAAGGGSGTVTSVGLSTSLSGLSVGSTPVTSSGTITLSGTLGMGSGGTGSTNAADARVALGTDNADNLTSGTVAAARIDSVIPRLGNTQTFSGASNIFSGDLHVGGTLNVSTQSVDHLDIGTLDLGTNIVAIVNGGTGATNAAGARSNLGTDNGSNITSGTVADVRIDSTIARDSEVAAGYQPLDADLTAMAAGTAVATAQTNAVSFGAPVLYVGTTNVAAALASMVGGGGGDIYSSSNNVFTATNTFSGMITLGGMSRSNWLPSQLEFYHRTEFLYGSGGTLSVAMAPWNGNAINSGTSAVLAGVSNHWGIVSISSAAGAGSGYSYLQGLTIGMSRPGDFSRFVWRPQNTNAGARVYLGHFDQNNTTSLPTDGVGLFQSNNFLYGQVFNNSTLYQSTTSANVESNVWYNGDYVVLSDSSVLFRLFSEAGSLLWSDTLSCSVATTRTTGHGINGHYTNAAAAVVANFDFMEFGNIQDVQR